MRTNAFVSPLIELGCGVVLHVLKMRACYFDKGGQEILEASDEKLCGRHHCVHILAIRDVVQRRGRREALLGREAMGYDGRVAERDTEETRDVGLNACRRAQAVRLRAGELPGARRSRLLVQSIDRLEQLFEMRVKRVHDVACAFYAPRPRGQTLEHARDITCIV
jgi:hypothetical protein